MSVSCAKPDPTTPTCKSDFILGRGYGNKVTHYTMISYVRLTLLLLCMSITRNEADNTEARAQTNKRHRIAMKQLILIMLVYVISFVPMTVAINDVSTGILLSYLYFVNNVSNFFIYLSVNKEFRKEAKNMVITMMNKVRPTAATVFPLQ